MRWLIVASVLAGCYLTGSLPFGYLLARRRGIDIRERGSGNIGATNVSRVLGPKAGAVVLLLDVLKGLVPTVLAGWVLAGSAVPGTAAHYGFWLLAALACIVGHVCPLYLRFKGGKGVATGLGATLGIFPELALPVACASVLWLVVTGIWRTVSLSSIVAVLSFPITTWLSLRPLELQRHWPLLLYAVLLPALVLYRHRGNIARLRAGTEPKISR
jgi:glycerol-3-phosphate acyltransferase PlsY